MTTSDLEELRKNNRLQELQIMLLSNILLELIKGTEDNEKYKRILEISSKYSRIVKINETIYKD